MATETTTSTGFAGFLQRVYTPEVGDWFLNSNVELWDVLKAETSLTPAAIGAGLYIPFLLQSAQSNGIPAQSGSVPTVGDSLVVQGTVTLAQFVNQIDVSWMLEKVTQGNGSWKPVMKFKMMESLTDLTKNINRHYAGTHGTGRLAQVNATVTSTDWVGKLPFGNLLLRPKMLVDVYQTDETTSSLTSKTISKIVPTTRTITMAASDTYTINYGIYIAGANGNTPNGLLSLIDDGNLASSLHGQSRSTYEELKAVVNSNSGTVRDLSETLLVRTALDIYQNSGKFPDLVLMNSGQWEKYLAFTRPDRRYNVSGDGAPSYDTGYKKYSTLMLGDTEAKIKVCSDIRPRTVFLANTSTLKRVGDARPDWMRYGGDPLVPGVSTTYTTSKMASLVYMGNIIQLQGNACGRIDDLSDPQLCGARVGGSDT